ncbi:unnamed protein product [Vitrella brassicaformis CCMP3155]|uniref:C3H1-type domain-containing protein n=1 Tax=Vitrella brassicaformis (strain CCMP3155) TaxID=1169540 RepID=A0A0G4EGN2_VITBC|nr:unnamed protein product [Vitrella brassicaformis CCMP3155]|eukprot:CEL94650.1 unnamed protein product [Vitrella brassicaformis CCMP3155]
MYFLTPSESSVLDGQTSWLKGSVRNTFISIRSPLPASARRRCLSLSPRTITDAPHHHQQDHLHHCDPFARNATILMHSVAASECMAVARREGMARLRDDTAMYWEFRAMEQQQEQQAADHHGEGEGEGQGQEQEGKAMLPPLLKQHHDTDGENGDCCHPETPSTVESSSSKKRRRKKHKNKSGTISAHKTPQRTPTEALLCDDTDDEGDSPADLPGGTSPSPSPSPSASMQERLDFCARHRMRVLWFEEVEGDLGKISYGDYDHIVPINPGSAYHLLGSCKQCVFYWTKGCMNGASCSFCHFHHPHKKQYKCKRRVRTDSRPRIAVTGDHGIPVASLLPPPPPPPGPLPPSPSHSHSHSPHSSTTTPSASNTPTATALTPTPISSASSTPTPKCILLHAMDTPSTAASSSSLHQLELSDDDLEEGGCACAAAAAAAVGGGAKEVVSVPFLLLRRRGLPYVATVERDGERGSGRHTRTRTRTRTRTPSLTHIHR